MTHLCLVRRYAADNDSEYDCDGCGENTSRLDEYYMVRDHIWRRAMPYRRGFLCIGCLELRIGQRLTPADFTAVPVNRYYGYECNAFKSPRLLSRLGYITDEQGAAA